MALLGAGQALVPARAQAAGPITLTVRLQPERIGMGETATLTIEARAGLSRIDLRPSFGMENLAIIAGPSQSDEMTVENGLFSRAIRLSWQVRPLAVGPARVHSIRIGVGGRIVGIPPQTIQVQQEPTGLGQSEEDSPFSEDPFERLFGTPPWMQRRPPPVANPNPEAPLAFIRAEVSNDHPFVNEQVLYTIYLYSRIEVSSVNPQSTPELRGFWARDVALPERLPTEIVSLGDLRYGRVPLMRRVLFPLRAGLHVLEPVRFQIATMQVERSLFSPSFARPMATDLSTPPLRIDVRPLPEAPPGFEGVVGPLALSASLTPGVLRVGEAATLKVRLAGSGNLQGLPTPALALPAGLRALPPHESGTDRSNGTSLRSERTWTYVVIPDRPGQYRLAPPAAHYFDPATATFSKAESPPLLLEARPPAPPAIASAPPESPRPGGSLRSATATGTGGPKGSRVSRARQALGGAGPLPWVIAGSGLMALGWWFGVKRTGLRRDEAARRFEADLAEARAEERPRRTAALLESAWCNLLAARWRLETPLPTSAWPGAAVERGLAPPLATELGRIGEDLQFLRTAPQLSNAEALRDEIIDRSRRLSLALRST